MDIQHKSKSLRNANKKRIRARKHKNRSFKEGGKGRFVSNV